MITLSFSSYPISVSCPQIQKTSSASSIHFCVYLPKFRYLTSQEILKIKEY